MMGHVLIPVRGCHHLLQRCVESVLGQDVPVRLLLVDNDSRDGAREYMWSLDPTRVQVIHYAPQKGVSYAWNRGLEYLFGTWQAEHVLVLNSDTRVRPDAYRRLVDDGGLFVTCVGTSSGAHFPGGEPDPAAKRPHPDFSCFLIRRECWQRVGSFDEHMVIYSGDGDYHLRMHRAGIEAVALDLPFYHYASGTLKHTSDADQQSILEQAQRDKQAFYDKWKVDMGTADYYELFQQVAPA